MSNPLSVRRVKVQTINADGTPDGEPTYGVMAADSNEQTYNDTFQTLEGLNKAIKDSKSILEVVDPDGTLFYGADHNKIGHDNYYGKDWVSDEENDEIFKNDDESFKNEIFNRGDN